MIKLRKEEEFESLGTMEDGEELEAHDLTFSEYLPENVADYRLDANKEFRMRVHAATGYNFDYAKGDEEFVETMTNALVELGNHDLSKGEDGWIYQNREELGLEMYNGDEQRINYEYLKEIEKDYMPEYKNGFVEPIADGGYIVKEYERRYRAYLKEKGNE